MVERAGYGVVVGKGGVGGGISRGSGFGVGDRYRGSGGDHGMRRGVYVYSGREVE